MHWIKLPYFTFPSLSGPYYVDAETLARSKLNEWRNVREQEERRWWPSYSSCSGGHCLLAHIPPLSPPFSFLALLLYGGLALLLWGARRYSSDLEFSIVELPPVTISLSDLISYSRHVWGQKLCLKSLFMWNESKFSISLHTNWLRRRERRELGNFGSQSYLITKHDFVRFGSIFGLGWESLLHA